MAAAARVLILDNFDSFTWNVARGFALAGCSVEVRRVDGIGIEEVEAFPADLLVISPGPGGPRDASLSLAALKLLAGRRPILGICLGLQCIAEAFGGRVDRGREPVHGKVSAIEHDGRGLFTGLPSPLGVGRYHSLRVVDVPPGFQVAARTLDEGIVMALRHESMPLAGLQFHPDSFLTEGGEEMLRNAARGLL